MKQEDLFEILGEMDEKFIAEAAEPVKKRKRKHLWKWGALAACLCLLAAGVYDYRFGGRELALSEQSKGVTVRYTNYVPRTEIDACLVYFTEEELFTEYDTAIFKGTVTKIDNIQLKFNGSSDYQALAEIQIEKVYRGDCTEGETVRVLLPGAVKEGYSNSIMDILKELEVGMTGIFMPTTYTKDSMYQRNGATLYLKDLADYGFVDGIRYAFLETEEGLVFAKSAYESIKDASTLDEVEEYIYRMLEQLHSGTLGKE